MPILWYILRHHSNVSPNVARDLRDAIRARPREMLLKDDETGDHMIVGKSRPFVDLVRSRQKEMYLYCLDRRVLAVGTQVYNPAILTVSDNEVLTVTAQIRRGHELDYSVPREPRESGEPATTDPFETR